VIDTSALLAALVAEHEHHVVARPHLEKITQIPAIVIAETYSQLRRTFGQSARVSAGLLAPWWNDEAKILPTLTSATSAILGRAVELDLGGNIHDALIAKVCFDHEVSPHRRCVVPQVVA